MIVTVQPSKILGTLQANASKSAMQRACAAALVSKGQSIIANPGVSNDDQAALSIIKNLGAIVQALPNGTLQIDAIGVKPIENGIHCGESGLSIRMFTPIAAMSSTPMQITGEGSLMVRPMDFFDEILPQLGVTINSNQGRLPLRVHGPLQPANIEIDGSLSSQFLTGLLMAYGASAIDQSVEIRVKNLKSKPYIDLTLELMANFGLNIPENKNYEAFVFSPSEEKKQDPVNYTVEGDWSGAAFLLVAGAIAGKVQVKSIFNTSRQADKKIVDALLDAGAKVTVMPESIDVEHAPLQAFVFDATDCPDLFPPLVALAANCKGVTRIHGLRRLKHKESDRGLTLQQEFAKLSIQVDLQDDIMLVHGGPLKVLNHTLNSHHDHRIAMAALVAAINADFEISIRNAEAVDKSYPDFYRHMQLLGVSVQIL